MDIKPIRNKHDYANAIARIEEIFDASAKSKESDELDVLVDLVEQYENEHYKIDVPDPIAAIQFRMEQAGLTRHDLEPLLGSRSIVSEVLGRKRPLTTSMIRALEKHFAIPAHVLLQDTTDEACINEADANDFPLKEVEKRGWWDTSLSLKKYGQNILQYLTKRAGGEDFVNNVLYRKNDTTRVNARVNYHAQRLWCLRIADLANSEQLPKYNKCSVSKDWIETLVSSSVDAQNLRNVKPTLNSIGIHFFIEPHLKHTHLDGSSFIAADGNPVIAMTLRYNRLDSFWFTLIHEIGHVVLHLYKKAYSIFCDDNSLRGKNIHEDESERQADAFAEQALRFKEIDQQLDRIDKTCDVYTLASDLRLHPAIVAGRIRHVTGNYKLFSKIVNSVDVKSML